MEHWCSYVYDIVTNPRTMHGMGTEIVGIWTTFRGVGALYCCLCKIIALRQTWRIQIQTSQNCSFLSIRAL